MKIKADTHDLEMSLMRAAGEIALRLKQMVTGFAYEFTVAAIDNTPLGDASPSNPDGTGGYLNLYLRRYQEIGLLPEEGFARGSWQIDFDGNLQMQELYGRGSGTVAGSAAKISMMNYNLGQTVYIGNIGPYIMNLEQGSSGQAPEGITKPTIDQVLSAYKVDLKRYYSNPL